MNSFIIPMTAVVKAMLISEMSFPIAHLMRSSCVTLHRPLCHTCVLPGDHSLWILLRPERRLSSLTHDWLLLINSIC